MKLIIIYGPEATGKLTIAKELANVTGFRVFHNHVSVDVAKTFFDFGTNEFGECDRYDIETSYVYVSCSYEELKKRVLQPDRNTMGKINTVEALDRQLMRKNHHVIPETDSLVIENTALPPQDVTWLIVTHFNIEHT